jgi:CRP-like cAMP-binding protein
MIFQKGDTIVNEGDNTFNLFVLMKGSIGVFKGDIQVSVFSEKGGILGEMSAILEKPRTASLIALETTTVVPIPSNFDLIIRENPEIAKYVMINLAKNLEKMTNEYMKIATHEQREEASNKLRQDGSMII